MDLSERALLGSLDVILESETVRAAINPIVMRVARALAGDSTSVMAWEPIPLSLYGGSLPPGIRSSWVFILRAGATTGAERHPNSHQRVMSYQGHGDLQVGGPGRWKSNHLASAAATLEGRWASVPPGVWHQAVVPGEDWVVVSFHTAPPHELIEERPIPRMSIGRSSVATSMPELGSTNDAKINVHVLERSGARKRGPVEPDQGSGRDGGGSQVPTPQGCGLVTVLGIRRASRVRPFPSP
jgi:hypothetical protein